jgi:small subunit ribosomal protein S16
MAVKLRMTRMGRRHRPFFRINAVESRTPRDGRILEKLGHYDPVEKDAAKQIVLNTERVKFWLEQGAVPSETVAEIIIKQGVPCPWYEDLQARRKKAREIARKAKQAFTKAEKIAAGYYPVKKEGE